MTIPPGHSYNRWTKLSLLVGLLSLIAPLGAQANTGADHAGPSSDPVRTRVVQLRGITTEAASEPVYITGSITETVATTIQGNSVFVLVTSALGPTTGRGVNTGRLYRLAGTNNITQLLRSNPIHVTILPIFFRLGPSDPIRPPLVRFVNVGLDLNGTAPASIDNITADLINN